MHARVTVYIAIYSHATWWLIDYDACKASSYIYIWYSQLHIIMHYHTCQCVVTQKELPCAMAWFCVVYIHIQYIHVWQLIVQGCNM